MIEAINSAFSYLQSQISAIRINDIIDILVVAVVLYYLFRFVRNRRASKLVVGIVFLFVLFLISDFFELHTIRFLMDNIFQVGIIAILIVFQPELRSMLESFGGQTNRIKGLTYHGADKNNEMVEALTEAVGDLAKDCTGALIVIERTTPLGDLAKSGTEINADISALLLRNIFFNKSPLHDGAVIIKGGRIHAAGCFLPLSMNTEIMKELGTRHRAALGASENSDAIVIVVSEETGVISVAREGSLRRGYSKEGLRKYLESVFILPTVKRKGRRIPKNNGEEKKDDK